ncbi:MAG: hypothetical protein IPL04_17800, partial [Chitinophagaceae bacterium]|nr:hypothetical protein [Chitinophagaceae bacterium]
QCKMPVVKTLTGSWRGWFYSTEVCDISLDTVKYANQILMLEPGGTKESTVMRTAKAAFNQFMMIFQKLEIGMIQIVFQTDKDTSLRDFYWEIWPWFRTIRYN